MNANKDMRSKQSFRPPSVPLITVDPYFSVWSAADRLYDEDTRHWTNKPHRMTGMIFVDGKPYRFMGQIEIGDDEQPAQLLPPLEQQKVTVEPLTTRYVFEGAGVELAVEFTTPLLLDDLELCTRPVTYVTSRVRSVDGHSHAVRIYFDVAGELAVHTPDQELVWSRATLDNRIEAMYIGTREQPVLQRAGDDTRIDWGYAYLALPAMDNTRTVIHSTEARLNYALTGQWSDADDRDKPRSAADNQVLMAAEIVHDAVDERQRSGFIMVAYDDLKSIEYFGAPLDAYWRRNGIAFGRMLAEAADEYENILLRCEAFNAALMNEAVETGGDTYKDMLALAYRQAVAAHKAVADEQGRLLFFSKENFSNGCIGTVDVSYPSIPLFLLYNTELVKGMMRPIFRYAGSGQWPFEFAPHDVGCYPKAGGQIYGEKPGEHRLEDQMPIEECGNMLIMAAAVSLSDKDAGFAQAHWELLSKWAAYLMEKGLDPANQLCTDDFGGHLAHNANLSVKAIVAIGAYSILCGMLGYTEEQAVHYGAAKRMASEWERMAGADDHYKLTFDAPDSSWSLKYNLVWDGLLGLGLFSDSVIEKERAYYLAKNNQYGTPLDNRRSYTKADWLVWCASLSNSKAEFVRSIEPLWHFLNESPSRVPFTDWYDTVTGRQTGFQNRSVVGGIFIGLLDKRV